MMTDLLWLLKKEKKRNNKIINLNSNGICLKKNRRKNLKKRIRMKYYQYNKKML
jgi:hypothetical protein